MRQAASTARLGIAALGALLSTAPAHAEGNRLLPFWGQPYPFGYAWTDVAPRPLGFAPCPETSGRPGASRHSRHDGRCEVVLHARD